MDELVFSKEKDPLNLFPFKMYGHYNTEGYQKFLKQFLNLKIFLNIFEWFINLNDKKIFISVLLIFFSVEFLVTYITTTIIMKLMHFFNKKAE